MMTRTAAAAIAAVALSLPAAAAPDKAPHQPASTAPTPGTGVTPAGAPGHWSIVSGETVSPGKGALSFELGWPGITVGYTMGMSDSTDVGIKADLLYGYYGTDTSQLGFGLRAPLRVMAMRRDRMGLQLHIDPGLYVYTTRGKATFGLEVPIGGVLGIAITPDLRIGIGADLPFFIQLTGPSGFGTSAAALILGPKFGFGIEYYVDRQLAVGLNTRFGPIWDTRGGDATFSFTTQVVIGYRM